LYLVLHAPHEVEEVKVPNDRGAGEEDKKEEQEPVYNAEYNGSPYPINKGIR